MPDKAPVFEYEPVACPLCGVSQCEAVREHRIVRRKNMPILKDVLDVPMRIVRCLGCGHDYLNPAPTDASLAAFYNESYFAADESSPENQNHDLSLAERVYFFLCRRPLRKDGRLLDIGAGNRKYLLWARGRGYEVGGFDGYCYPCAAGAEDIPMSYGDFETAAVPGAPFDIITMWWVIEHVRRPQAFLEKALSLLGPGGEIVVATTNYAALDARFWGDYWHHLVLPEHLSQFHMDSLVRVMEAAGFRITRKSYDVMSFDTTMSLWEFCRYRLGFRLPLENLVVKAASLPFGWIRSLMGTSGLITVHGARP